MPTAVVDSTVMEATPYESIRALRTTTGRIRRAIPDWHDSEKRRGGGAAA
jgi:hypothetical protein